MPQTHLTVGQIHALAIDMAIKADPRGPKGVKRWLEIAKKQHKQAPKGSQNDLLSERTTNPYMDSRILFDTGQPVKKILVGIDISVGEVMLANHLGDIDLIISHHPEGNALANLDEVMHLQADLLNTIAELPINVAESVIRKRAKEIQRRIHPANHHQSVDAAKLLGISMISEHTTTDNLVWKFIDDVLTREQPELVGDVIDSLRKIPEYKEGLARGEGPIIFAGRPDNRVGKLIGSEFTGGTELGKEIYEPLARVGTGTIVGMHMKDESREEAEKYHINVVIAGHMSSDSLGMNLFLDQLEKKGIEIVPCSGLIRVSRN